MGKSRSMIHAGLIALVCFGVVLMFGCGGSTRGLTPAGQTVGLGKVQPHAGCRELGIVMGTGGGGGYTSSESKMQMANNRIRNKTAELGGDFVVLDTSGGDLSGITLTGRAFDCSAGPPQSQPVPVQLVQPGPAPAGQPANTELTVEERMLQLKDLHTKGLITDAEYETRRQAILSEI